MSRTLQDLPLGTKVYVPFVNDEFREYIVIQKDSVSIVLLQNFLYESKRMNSQGTAVYDGSEMDTWLNNSTNGFMSMLTEDMQSRLVSRSIDTFVFGEQKTQIARRIYLLSYYEVFGEADGSIPTEGSIVYPALYLVTHTDGNGRIGRGYVDGHPQRCWLRSPYSTTQFRFVSTTGIADYNTAVSSNYVRPALSVASTTIVSDEGSNTIYLIPDGQPVTRLIDAIDYIGESATRPAKAIVRANALGLSNVEIHVTNNAKDETPVWVDATGGGVVTLTNTSKTTDKWQVAVKIHGESPNFGATMEEPYVITLEE